ncbi:MAG TPA: hypothetical protein VJL34_13990, partial [Anaerolineales bacterium]|nr:hypothetical protein [Anaerolineales bacterium]
MNALSPKRSARERWAAGLFWSWNVIFLAFMALGFAPRMLPLLYESLQNNLVPAVYLIYALVLTFIPVAVVLLGLTVLRGAPARLFALG